MAKILPGSYATPSDPSHHIFQLGSKGVSSTFLFYPSKLFAHPFFQHILYPPHVGGDLPVDHLLGPDGGTGHLGLYVVHLELIILDLLDKLCLILSPGPIVYVIVISSPSLFILYSILNRPGRCT